LAAGAQVITRDLQATLRKAGTRRLFFGGMDDGCQIDFDPTSPDNEQIPFSNNKLNGIFHLPPTA
jgi:hypothetical protein